MCVCKQLRANTREHTHTHMCIPDKTRPRRCMCVSQKALLKLDCDEEIGLAEDGFGAVMRWWCGVKPVDCGLHAVVLG